MFYIPQTAFTPPFPPRPPPLFATLSALQAVPMQKLREKTFVASAKEVSRHHASWLRSNKHLRYMWIPYTDSVVVVQVNPEGPAAVPSLPHQQQQGLGGGVAQQQAGAATQSAYGDIVQEEAVSDRCVQCAGLAPAAPYPLHSSPPPPPSRGRITYPHPLTRPLPCSVMAQRLHTLTRLT